MDIRKARAVLDPSDVPFDITFVIDDCGSKVRAHKLIMAMGSPVCKKQFYGELRETKDEIVIKNTTRNAFAAMVDNFYGKEIKWTTKTAEEIFEIANMAEKYQVAELMKDVEEALKEYPVNEGDVVEIAYIAEAYSRLETPSQILLRTCAKFLSSVLSGRKDFVAFSAKYSKTAYTGVVLMLFALMEEENPPLPSCCGLTTCRRGKPVMVVSDLVVGDTVKMNPDGCDPNVGRYMTEGVEKKVADIYPSIIVFDCHFHGIMSKNGHPNFLFCKC